MAKRRSFSRVGSSGLFDYNLTWLPRGVDNLNLVTVLIELAIAGNEWDALNLGDTRVDEICPSELLKEVRQVQFCRLSDH